MNEDEANKMIMQKLTQLVDANVVGLMSGIFINIHTVNGMLHSNPALIPSARRHAKYILDSLRNLTDGLPVAIHALTQLAGDTNNHSTRN